MGGGMGMGSQQEMMMMEQQQYMQQYPNQMGYNPQYPNQYANPLAYNQQYPGEQMRSVDQMDQQHYATQSRAIGSMQGSIGYGGPQQLLSSGVKRILRHVSVPSRWLM
jgi:hypothetical protein